MSGYKHLQVEPKWRDYWKANNTYKIDNDSDKPKYYVLDMFPYPSGAGLHVGHPLGYIASDIFARFKRMNGFNVLHPMGFDAFGLPAEQYALQTGIHPAVSTSKNIEKYIQQLGMLGFSYDWSRQVTTCDPNYYKWTQWIFTLLFDHYYDLKENKAKSIASLKAHFAEKGNQDISAASEQKQTFTAEEWAGYGSKQQAEILMNYRLAYRKTGYVNWCEGLGTVLANDQIKDGLSERGGFPVEKKAMTQWYLRITAYADRLLSGMDTIDWSESLKTMQRNWIGKSSGATVFFPIKGHEEKLEIYTTRPDTIFGATYMVLAPEHPYVDEIVSADQREAVTEYIAYVKSKSEIDRMAEKEVTGVFTGAYCIHPINKTEIPIYLGEYVLMDYGTGAIMAVPSDDDRDKVFAEKFGLDIIDVVDKSKYPEATLSDKVGVIINSEFLNGMEVPEAITMMNSYLAINNIGHEKINYKLRDANFSRQRYWGEPFPIVYDENDIAHALPLSELPVTLPETDDFKPSADGGSPLSKKADWVTTSHGNRETDTMPAVAGSSWYYLRYMDPNNDGAFASKEAISYWQDVDLYLGGAEHAVAHLMYARFWHKFLYDLGYVPTEEPFKKLINQGKIQGVIESLYLLKEKVDGQSVFYSADLVQEEDVSKYARMPVPIEYVTDYGSDSSYLDAIGIGQYTNWSADFKNAKFIGPNGYWEKGTYHGDGDFQMLTHSESGKMSKSKYNVINPDDIIEQYGTDTFRLYEMFLGPLEADKPWDTKGIEGVYKFLRKLWSLFYDQDDKIVTDAKPDKAALKVLHQCIDKVTQDIARFSMNTCVSHFMICVNELKKLKCHSRDILGELVKLIAPFAPHIAEELWETLGHKESIHLQDFPQVNKAYLVEDEVEYPVCFNGKKRFLKSFPTNYSPDQIKKEVLELDETEKYLAGKQIIKTIVVPKRMINIVVKG